MDLVAAILGGAVVVKGFLRLNGPDAVLDTGEREIFVPLTQIRWVVDPRTGARVAGPW